MTRAAEIVDILLDHCGRCPSDRAKRHAIGVEVEGEHTDDPTEKEKIARTHEKENPLYYPHKPKPKGAKEALRWVKARPKPKMSFYPSMGGPSSV